MNRLDYYRVLGLYDGASIYEIKAAYRRLALRYHPDKNTSKYDEEKFKIITEAYRVLRTGNTVTRSDYIQSGYCDKDSIGVKIPYWNELYLDKIFNKQIWLSGYAKSYLLVAKYKQKLYRYCTEIVQNTKKVLLSYLKYDRITPSTFHVCNYLLNTIPKNIRSKLKP